MDLITNIKDLFKVKPLNSVQETIIKTLESVPGEAWKIPPEDEDAPVKRSRYREYQFKQNNLSYKVGECDTDFLMHILCMNPMNYLIVENEGKVLEEVRDHPVISNLYETITSKKYNSQYQ